MPSLVTAASDHGGTRSLAGLLVQSDLIALAVVRDGCILFANGAFRKLFGHSGGLAGVPFMDLFVSTSRGDVVDALQSVGRSPADCIASAMRSDGSAFETELRCAEIVHGGTTLVAVFAQDVTKRRQTEAQLGLMAYSDPLTGLANRAMFADRLRQAALSARRAHHMFGLLMLDLDGFKAVNDGYGHDAGDHVLQQIARGFMTCLRESDTIARLGGDEFVVLLAKINAPEDAAHIAARLIEAARMPVNFGEEQLRIGTSVGIAIFPEHASGVDHLLAAADTALYVAKRQGRGCYVWASQATTTGDGPQPPLWSVAHEIGIGEIDAQHAMLASLLDQLVVVLRNGEDHQGNRISK